ncbi:MAG: 16S rRNA (uracil(1498)-N(3))-methyltransferase [Planctomycetota bacterium]
MRHTLYWERDPSDREPPPIGGTIEVGGDEAMHATKSKRLREGDGCVVCDGAGTLASCVVERATKSRVTLRVDGVERAMPASPRVEVFGATPKGQRLDKMLDMLGQCGCALWRPLTTARGVVEPGAHKLERARRIGVEALKQSGRAHLMAIGGEASFEEALAPDEGVTILLADGEGVWRPPTFGEVTHTVRVLVGPEGGFTPGERATALERDAGLVRLGVHVMRIETASVVATAWAMMGGEGHQRDA